MQNKYRMKESVDGKTTISDYKLLFWKEASQYIETNIKKDITGDFDLVRIKTNQDSGGLNIEFVIWEEGEIYYNMEYSITIEDKTVSEYWLDMFGNKKYKDFKYSSDESSDYISISDIYEKFIEKFERFF